MRLTTAIWLGIFMRLEAQRGAFVSVLQKGAQQAGTAFVVHRKRDGSYDIYGPAPQSLVDEPSGNRVFELVCKDHDEREMQDYLDRQRRFDPDLWIIESEAGEGPISLELAKG